MKVLVCTMKRSGPMSSCGSRGGENVFEKLSIEASTNVPGIQVEKINCLGYCEEGPNVRIPSKGKLWSGVNDSSIQQIIDYCEESLSYK